MRAHQLVYHLFTCGSAKARNRLVDDYIGTIDHQYRLLNELTVVPLGVCLYFRELWRYLVHELLLHIGAMECDLKQDHIVKQRKAFERPHVNEVSNNAIRQRFRKIVKLAQPRVDSRSLPLGGGKAMTACVVWSTLDGEIGDLVNLLTACPLRALPINR